MDNPTPELPAGWAELIWKEYERFLPDAARALEEPTFDHAHWTTIPKHIQAAWIRNAGFDHDAVTHLATPAATLSNDEIQRVRKEAHDQVLALLAGSRFAVVRRSELAPRFIIDNRGFVPLRDVQAGQSGVLFPLTGNVAVLMVLDTAGQAGAGRRQRLGDLVSQLRILFLTYRPQSQGLPVVDTPATPAGR